MGVVGGRGRPRLFVFVLVSQPALSHEPTTGSRERWLAAHEREPLNHVTDVERRIRAMECRLRSASELDRTFLCALHCTTMREVAEKTWGWDEAWQRADFDRRFAEYVVWASARLAGPKSRTRPTAADRVCSPTGEGTGTS